MLLPLSSLVVTAAAGVVPEAEMTSRVELEPPLVDTSPVSEGQHAERGDDRPAQEGGAERDDFFSAWAWQRD